MSQHFINDPHTIPTEAVTGLVAATSGTKSNLTTLAPHFPSVVVLRHVQSTEYPAIISGGGSGHEPMHGSFVAPGWLSAAIAGRAFASPPGSSTNAAIEYCLDVLKVPSVLVVIKNYTGDGIHFGAAVEAAKAKYGPTRVVSHVFGDDVSLGIEDENNGSSPFSPGARRAIAGTVLFYKMLAAVSPLLAQTPKEQQLATLHAVAQAANVSIRSIGASLASTSIPGVSAAPPAALKKGHVEVGLGIHGEPGARTIPFRGANALVEHMLEQIYTPTTASSGKKNGGNAWPTSAPMSVFVNNLGGTSLLEMNLIARSVMEAFGKKGGAAMNGFGTGTACSALSMHGFSVTAFSVDAFVKAIAASKHQGLPSQLTDPKFVLEKLVYSDNGSAAAGVEHLPPYSIKPVNPSEIAALLKQPLQAPPPPPSSTPTVTEGELNIAGKKLVTLFNSLLKYLASREQHYNAADAAVGDGDTGEGVRAAAQKLLESSSVPLVRTLADAVTKPAPKVNASAAMAPIARIVTDEFAGSMGALTSVFMCGFAAGIDKVVKADGAGSKSFVQLIVGGPKPLADALGEGVAYVVRVGNGQRNARTFLDVFFAAVDSLQAATKNPPKPYSPAAVLVPAVGKARLYVRTLLAKRGRARYLGKKVIGKADPGSEIMADLFEFLGKNGGAVTGQASKL